MANTFVFRISTSEPTSGLINRLSLRSFNKVPRKLNLTRPRATCTKTTCPTQGSNAFFIFSPSNACLQGNVASVSEKDMDTVKNDSLWTAVSPDGLGAMLLSLKGRSKNCKVLTVRTPDNYCH